MPHICKARQGKPLHGPADTAPGTLGSVGRNSRSLAPETNLGKGRPQTVTHWEKFGLDDMAMGKHFEQHHWGEPDAIIIIIIIILSSSKICSILNWYMFQLFAIHIPFHHNFHYIQHLVPEVMSQQHISSLLVTYCDIQRYSIRADKTRFPQVLSYSIRLTFSPASVSLDVTFIFPMVTRHTKTAKTPSSRQGNWNCAFNDCNKPTRTQRCSKNFIHFTRFARL